MGSSPAAAALLAVTVLATVALTVGGWWYNARLAAALAQSEASATEARVERERAASTFQKNLETIDDLGINLDGRLAQRPDDLESVRVEFLREFLAIAEKLQQENSNDPIARGEQSSAARPSGCPASLR